MHFPRLFATVGLALAAFATGAFAQEAAIREAIAKRVPQLKSIDEVRPAGIPGLYEVRANGVEIYYTDAKGNYLIQGNLYETKGLRNLTEERINKLTSIKFSSLPSKTPSPSCGATARASWPFLRTRTAATANALSAICKKSTT